MDAAVAPAAEPAKRAPSKRLSRRVTVDGERCVITTAAAGHVIDHVERGEWQRMTGRHRVGVVTREAPGAEPAEIDARSFNKLMMAASEVAVGTHWQGTNAVERLRPKAGHEIIGVVSFDFDRKDRCHHARIITRPVRTELIEGKPDGKQ